MTKKIFFSGNFHVADYPCTRYRLCTDVQYRRLALDLYHGSTGEAPPSRVVIDARPIRTKFAADAGRILPEYRHNTIYSCIPYHSTPW